MVKRDKLKTKEKKKLDVYEEKKRKKWENYKWSLKLTILAFAISFSFSFLSEVAMKNASLLISSIIVLCFVLIGVLFDMVGMAVATAAEAPLHSMSSRGIKSAKVGVILKRNANKVSSFCQDVIGDICGIISGSAGVVIATTVSSMWDISLLLCSLITTATIAALTIGGKAFEKNMAIQKSNEILNRFAKILGVFYVGK